VTYPQVRVPDEWSATRRKVPARQSEPTLAGPLFVDATQQDRYRPLDAALREAVRRRPHGQSAVRSPAACGVGRIHLGQ
jgi:hypothetical protein